MYGSVIKATSNNYKHQFTELMIIALWTKVHSHIYREAMMPLSSTQKQEPNHLHTPPESLNKQNTPLPHPHSSSQSPHCRIPQSNTTRLAYQTPPPSLQSPPNQNPIASTDPKTESLDCPQHCRLQEHTRQCLRDGCNFISTSIFGRKEIIFLRKQMESGGTGEVDALEG